MKYEEILIHLKEGRKAYRKGWNGIEAGIEMYVFIVSNARFMSMICYSKDEHQINKFDIEPFFIFYHDSKGTHTAWEPSTWDNLTDDWELVPGPQKEPFEGEF